MTHCLYINTCIYVIYVFKDNGQYLGWRSTPDETYKWICYKDAEDIIQAIGSGFIELGLEPRKGEKIGIYARNRPEVVL